MVDTIRYWLAVLTVATLPPALLYWYLIHPFATTWRKVGRLPAYLVVSGICLTAVYAIFRLRDQLLAADYGFDPLLSALGVAPYLAAVYLEIQCRKHLKFHILAGAPELSKDSPGKLLQGGIYGRIRHPRYVSLTLGVAGVALFLNYRAVYLLLLLFVPAIFGLVLLEERELRQRFGAAYVDYSRRVPRFLPRRR